MNIFILNTGRCGSTTITKACQHITNYTSEHESRTHLIGDERMAYPPNHIEADNRLSWLLGRLDEAYGDSAFYVHLTRERKGTAQSFVNRYSGGIIKAYRGTGIMMNLPDEIDPLAVSMDYCETVDSNIRLFLKDKTQKMDIRLESIEDDFAQLWKNISAEGNLEKALSEFSVKYNASKEPETQKGSLLSRLRSKK